MDDDTGRADDPEYLLPQGITTSGMGLTNVPRVRPAHAPTDSSTGATTASPLPNGSEGAVIPTTASLRTGRAKALRACARSGWG